MLHQKNDECGFALIYALIVLLIVTMGGTALLFMSQKDKTGGTNFSSMHTTAKAAEAALKACEGQFMNHPDTALAILKAFAKNNKYKWICNSSVAESETEVRYALNSGTNASRYCTKIISFDSTTALLTVEGIGYGDFGAKKKATALYKLDGIEIVIPPPKTITVPAGRFVLYIAKDGESFNFPANITGNVYFGGAFNMQTVGNDVTINGNLKTGSSVVSGLTTIKNKLFVNGNAYFQSAVTFQNSISTVTGRVGFEKTATLNTNLIANGDSVYSNSTSGGSAKISMQPGKIFLHSGSFPSSSVSGGTVVSNGGAISDIGARVGICPGNETGVTIDITKIPAAFIQTYTAVFGTSYAVLTADRMNTYYENNPTRLWNGYLVIDANTGFPQWSANPGTFNYKVIWLLRSSGTCWNPPLNNYMYNSGTGPGCSSIFHLSNGSQISPCGWTGTLRGYIYVDGTGLEAVKFYNYNQTFVGATHVMSSGNDPFEFTGPSTGSNVLKLTYDEGVIQDLVNVGLATWPAGSCEVHATNSSSSSSDAPELKLVDLKIRPRLLSLQL
jgi:hypothetical protein